MVSLLAAASPILGQARSADQVCEQGRISNIFIDNHDIFDLEQLEQGTAIRWAYSLANALHVRTTKSFIRRELLFEVGDCLDRLRLEESGRILRQYGFIASADVFAVAQPDGTYHVVVDTQDEWTTKIDLGIAFDDGLQLEVLDITEENLLGQGILAGAFIRKRRERDDRGLLLQFPRLFGSRTDVNFGVGRTRNGSFFNQSVEYPFVGEIGRVALREVFVRRDELFAFSAGDGQAFSHALLPYVDERAELSLAGRIGRPGNLTLFGVGISRETLEFGGFPGDVDVAIDNNFGEPAVAPAGVTDVISTQAGARSVTRLNLMVGQRNLHFVRARGLDNLHGVQDVQLGTDVGLTIGRSVDMLSKSGLPSPDDLYTRLRIFAGHDPGSSFVFANVALEGRRLVDLDGPGGPWRDFLAEGDVYAYLRSEDDAPRHTVFARASASGGWSMVSPFQLSLGGRTAVRGFREENLPGAQRLLLTLEDRISIGGVAPDLVDFGVTLFADAGRVWAGDVPYGVDSGWKGAAGFGLRLGFPAGSRVVTRMDLAFPVGGGGGGPIFRTALELTGILRGFEDPQMSRSRRLNIGPDKFVTEIR